MIKNLRTAFAGFLLSILLVIFFWLPIPVFAGAGIWTTNGPYGDKIYDIKTSPNYSIDNTIFAGTYGQGVFKSNNKGASWNSINNGLNNYIISLAVSPNYDNIVGINGTASKTIFAGTPNNGIFKSTNGGASWSPVNTGIGVNFIDAIAISPNFISDSTVFVGSSSGVYKSTNGGVNWTQKINGMGFLGININSIAISPNYDNIFGITGTASKTIFVGTGIGVYKSTDGGDNWSPINTFLTNTDIKSLAVSPNFVTDDTIFAGTNGGSLFKSISRGASWFPANAGLNSSINDLAVSPNYDNSGTNGTASKTIFASTSAGVFISNNGGTNWTAINTGLPQPTTSLAISPGLSSSKTVFAGTVNAGVYSYTTSLLVMFKTGKNTYFKTIAGFLILMVGIVIVASQKRRLRITSSRL